MAAELRKFPSRGMRPGVESIEHTVELLYTNRRAWTYPDFVKITSSYQQNGNHVMVFQNVTLKMGHDAASSGVQYLCAGVFTQDAPTSFNARNIQTSRIPC